MPVSGTWRVNVTCDDRTLKVPAVHLFFNIFWALGKVHEQR